MIEAFGTLSERRDKIVVVSATGGLVEPQRIKSSELLAYCQLRGISVPGRKARDLEFYVGILDEAFMRVRSGKRGSS